MLIILQNLDRTLSRDIFVRFTNLVEWLLIKTFMTCFMFFYRTALATAYGRCFPGQNIWLRPNVKIVPTVQHWFLILTNLEFLMGGVKNLGTLDLTLIKGFSKKTSVLKFFVILFKENCPRQWSMVYLMKKRKALGYTVLGPDFLFVRQKNYSIYR